MARVSLVRGEVPKCKWGAWSPALHVLYSGVPTRVTMMGVLITSCYCTGVITKPLLQVETRIDCPLSKLQTFWYRRILLKDSTMLVALEAEAAQADVQVRCRCSRHDTRPCPMLPALPLCIPEWHGHIAVAFSASLCLPAGLDIYCKRHSRCV